MNTLDLIDSWARFAHPRQQLLHDFVLGKVSKDMAKAVRFHLSRCGDCRELAQLFAGTDAVALSADVIPISEAARSTAAPAWRPRTEERLAAAHRIRGAAWPSDNGPDGAPVVEPVPGATDGTAALGYLCGGSSAVVVTGAAGGMAHVRLGEKTYLLASPDEAGIRVVEGMSRQDVTLWLARGGARDGTFAVVHE